MSKRKKAPEPPQRVPFLTSQPINSEDSTAVQMVSRYGTYEIQPTADTEHFFPTIGAGEYDAQQLARLRRQSEIGTDPDAKHDLVE